MTVAEQKTTVSLWNWYRTRRHISTGKKHPMSAESQQALCGGWFHTEEHHIQTLRRYNGPVTVEKYIAKMQTVPLCKFCERKAAAGQEEGGSE